MRRLELLNGSSWQDTEVQTDHYSGISPEDLIADTAKSIMALFMNYRRTVKGEECCVSNKCEKCMNPHIDRINASIRSNKPVSFVLPAFPGKSPNSNKVLGVLPDMAEKLALVFLNDLCEQVKDIYAPGARIILCSDGRVFSDVVKIKEEHITQYQNYLELIISEEKLVNLSTFNLDQVCDTKNFDQLREELMEEYGQSLEDLRSKVKLGGNGSEDAECVELNRLYCGITRFLVEDDCVTGEVRSKTSIQKECRKRAYEVIRRSNAWSGLLEKYYPQAVRLSIHPQTCGSKKFGIQLLGTDSWMTPWHGVAVDTGRGFELMKRWQVENLSSELVYDVNGNPSYFRLIDQDSKWEAVSEL